MRDGVENAEVTYRLDLIQYSQAKGKERVSRNLIWKTGMMMMGQKLRSISQKGYNIKNYNIFAAFLPHNIDNVYNAKMYQRLSYRFLRNLNSHNEYITLGPNGSKNV